MGLLKLIGMAVITNEVRYAFGRELERKRKAIAAREYADSVQKPLLVVGGPNGSGPSCFLRRLLCDAGLGYSHESGDVCIDLDPDSFDWDSGTINVVADVREIPYPDGFFGAAFVSHVLEHLPSVKDGDMAYTELRRVADRVYVTGPTKMSLNAHLTSSDYHPLWVNVGDNGIKFEKRSNLFILPVGIRP